jgi:hypothetical protein
MDLARHVGEWSKDRTTKVGCVIVGPRNEIRAIGYNGFVRGTDDDDDSKHKRPDKYIWSVACICHGIHASIARAQSCSAVSPSWLRASRTCRIPGGGQDLPARLRFLRARRSRSDSLRTLRPDDSQLVLNRR